jgi:hypothetical protein
MTIIEIVTHRARSIEQEGFLYSAIAIFARELALHQLIGGHPLLEIILRHIGRGVRVLQLMQIAAVLGSCQVCNAGAKYPLKEVKAALQEAREGHGQGKVLLEG